MLVLVVMGTAASGKTAVGRALVSSSSTSSSSPPAATAKFIDADDYHPPANIAKMKAGIPLTDTDRIPWLQRLCDSIISEQASSSSPSPSETSPVNTVVVACSCLKRAYRDAIRQLLRSSSAATPANQEMIEIRFAFLHCDRNVIEQRARQRQGHFFNPSLIQSQFDILEPPSQNEVDSFWVNGNMDLNNVCDDIKKRIEAYGFK